MATRGKSNSSKKLTKKEQMEQMERAEAFRQEVFLWVVVAVSLLLFISNIGIGGKIGGAVSGFLFGVFGFIAYVFPVLLLVGCFFAVSNKDNMIAILKLVAAIVFVLFLCFFMSLVVSGADIKSPVEAFQYSREKRIGGGVCGGTLAYLLVPAFGLVGSYIIDVIVLIILLVFLTGHSAIKGMKKGGQKVYASAKENSERYQEYREYKSEERARRREEKKVSGVAADTRIRRKKSEDSDEISELHPEEALDMPKVVEAKKVTIDGDMKDVEIALQGFGELQKGDGYEHSFSESAPVISGDFMNEANAYIPDRYTDSVPVEEDAEEFLSNVRDSGKSLEELLMQEAIAVEEPPVAERTRHKATADPEELEQEVNAVAMEIEMEEPVRNYVFPPVSLLKKSEARSSGNTQDQLRETAGKLQQTLKTFGVNVTVTNISCGPAVTRYEIQPEMGVKVSKIVGLADDLKLNLAAADIRIEAPIPGKAAIGIEVPNKENVMVSFRELIESDEFKEAKSNIAFAVGKDIGGKVKVADIAKMPHLLIAGATGSGKSVCINTIIMSILYKADPNDVKLVMIDPKVVELSVYNGIPHLMIPVVTDPKKAAGALNWAVAEMTERYNRFAEANVREIGGYNAKIESMELPEGMERPKKMPQIVIIVDELADLMMVASGDVEEAICRLAQLARAAGIHLIIATQRPSVNVITGLIKANMPSRIAFAVTSGVDSRTILDMVGAEKLLGKGDMLFYPQGIPKPLRVQGAFVSDKEVSDVVAFLTENNGQAQYSDDVQKKMESIETAASKEVAISDGESGGDGRDTYFIEAAQIIVDKEKASIGMLQRYLKVGFNRAARIMDQLEEAGIVGPEEGTKPRRVLMNPEEFQQYIDENGDS